MPYDFADMFKKDVGQIRARLAELASQLEAMPGYRKNTRYHEMIVKEKQSLLAELDRIMEKARMPALAGR
jgi:hypothetical protein